MKVALNLVAVFLLLGGSVFVLQGCGILPGSYMTGDIQWAYRGGAAAAVGLLILLLPGRPRSGG